MNTSTAVADIQIESIGYLAQPFLLPPLIIIIIIIIIITIICAT